MNCFSFRINLIIVLCYKLQLDQFSLKLFGVKKLNYTLEMDPSKIILDLALAMVSVTADSITNNMVPLLGLHLYHLK